MAIESLAFLAVSLYSSGVGGYLWLARRAARDSGYERVPVEEPQEEPQVQESDPLDLEVLSFLCDVESKSDQDMLDLLKKL